MSKLFFRVAANEWHQWLEPSDRKSEEFMGYKVKEGDIVTATIRRPRWPKHHRKLFVLLDLIHESSAVQDMFPTTENLLDALKHETGHVEIWRTIGGEVKTKPKSIAFESMDQTAFEDFYSRALDIIVTQLVPHMDREDLVREVERMLK